MLQKIHRSSPTHNNIVGPTSNYDKAGLNKSHPPFKSSLRSLSTLPIGSTIKVLEAYPKDELEGKDDTPRHKASKVTNK